ncbi:hypothetical protein KEM60_01627 [Austwickia sp. TVS 96-490-7B]|uniref:ABC transporter permease n=1 Tax=Austwickia sp. TVS 96-490-7B TaxID=2830843 RepID=UPI001C586DC9|nr:ABC transporter permease [Austwickia sp. TVS 96-490-7B]MBW3085427.1 hypothetical protein [Austwickia sp. TVS 96-490-7B]
MSKPSSASADTADVSTASRPPRDSHHDSNGTARAARPWVRVAAAARFDALIILRNGEQLLVSLLLPALALIGLTLSPFPSLGPGPRVDVAVPGALALALLSSAFTGQAIGLGFDRRYGVLRLWGTTPLGRDGFLYARVLAVLLVQGAQVCVVGVVGVVMGWRPSWEAIPGVLLFWIAGTAAFVALAFVFAGTLRAEAVLATANLLWVVMAGAGGVLSPTHRYPAPWGDLLGWLPPGALGEGMRSAMVSHTVAWGSLGVLLCWATLLAAVATRTFRWSD